MHIVDRRYTRAEIADMRCLTCVNACTCRTVKHNVIDRRALVILMTQKLIVFAGQRLIARLCNPPRLANIACRIHAAQVVSHTRHNTLWQNGLRVLLCVHGVEGDALIGLSEHDLLKRCSFEECLTGFLPLLISRGSEFIERDFGEIFDFRRFLQKLLKLFVTRPFFFFRHSTSSFILFGELGKLRFLQKTIKKDDFFVKKAL